MHLATIDFRYLSVWKINKKTWMYVFIALHANKNLPFLHFSIYLIIEFIHHQPMVKGSKFFGAFEFGNGFIGSETIGSLSPRRCPLMTLKMTRFRFSWKFVDFIAFIAFITFIVSVAFVVFIVSVAFVNG